MNKLAAPVRRHNRKISTSIIAKLIYNNNISIRLPIGVSSTNMQRQWRSPAAHWPISRLELPRELCPLLLVLPLQVLDGQRDALLAVGSQAAALRRGRGAGRRREGTAITEQRRRVDSQSLIHNPWAEVQSGSSEPPGVSRHKKLRSKSGGKTADFAVETSQ